MCPWPLPARMLTASVAASPAPWSSPPCPSLTRGPLSPALQITLPWSSLSLPQWSWMLLVTNPWDEIKMTTLFFAQSPLWELKSSGSGTTSLRTPHTMSPVRWVQTYLLTPWHLWHWRFWVPDRQLWLTCGWVQSLWRLFLVRYEWSNYWCFLSILRFLEKFFNTVQEAKNRAFQTFSRVFNLLRIQSITGGNDTSGWGWWQCLYLSDGI